MKKIVLATQNKHKLSEVRQMLEPLGYEVLSLGDVSLGNYDVIEDGDTFEANALKKAQEIAALVSLPVLADDSGLMVDALSGAPGVFSARYAGEGASASDNNIKLLNALLSTPDDERTAKFVCVMAYVNPDGGTNITRGEVKGLIIKDYAGNAGFGYDPIFYVPELGKTYAELLPGEKNGISHRFLALTQMRLYFEGEV